jgi:hypothetical protein
MKRRLLARFGRMLAWLGFIATVLFGIVGIYSGFFYSRSPALVFQEIANTPVFALNERVEQLRIVYEGQDLASSDKALTFLQLRVVNNGSGPILQTFFDPRALPGIDTAPAHVLRAEVIGASTAYVLDNSSLDVSTNRVTFRPIILEPGDYFVVKLLLLHDRKVAPKLKTIGKVASVGTMTYLPLEFTREPSLLSQAFVGGLWVQALRLFGYVVALILVIVAIAWPSTAISEARARRTRRRFVSAALSDPATSDPIHRHLLEQYQEHGPFYLHAVQNALRYPQRYPRRSAHLHTRDMGEAVIFDTSRLVTDDLAAIGVFNRQPDGTVNVDNAKAAEVRRLITQILRDARRK